MLKSGEPLISIILLTKNGMPLIRECLNGIFSQKIDEPYEVIAIDSGSHDRTIDAVRQFPVKLVQIPSEEFGHGRTRNQGASLARGDFLVFITQDATPANNEWLRELVDPVKKDQDVAGAYSRWIPRASGHIFDQIWIKDRFGAEGHIRKIGQEGFESYRKNIHEYIFFSNVSSCLRRSVWKKTPFDDGALFAEDQLWAKQVIESGHAVAYAAVSEVLHSHNDPLKVHLKKIFDGGYAFKGISGTSKPTSKTSWMVFFLRVAELVKREERSFFGFLKLLAELMVRWMCQEIAAGFGFFWRGISDQFKLRRSEKCRCGCY